MVLKERLNEIKPWLRNLTWGLFIVFEKIYIVFIWLIKKFISYMYATTRTQIHILVLKITLSKKTFVASVH